ncbi:MAG: nuclear transport factor 2 family protein [Lewinellaceae bacterium]|nr:nuclear transport factor 2 family protein [Lewinellaceae bacterium]
MTLRSFSLLVLFVCSVGKVAAQGNSNLQDEINQQIWRPFMATYASLDGAAFMQLHSPDVIRVLRDQQKIIGGRDYWDDTMETNQRTRSRNIQRSIVFSFTERIAQGELAYESGYYRVDMKIPGQELRSYYGHFQVVLRKENGRWRILVDSDTSENGALTADDFAKGTPLAKD